MLTSGFDLTTTNGKRSKRGKKLVKCNGTYEEKPEQKTIYCTKPGANSKTENYINVSHERERLNTHDSKKNSFMPNVLFVTDTDFKYK